jgi:hypothetical protein
MESDVTTDSQSASLSWNEASIWGLRPYINYCLTITVLFLWGALSDERTGLSVVYASSPRQCSPSWVWGPLISRTYFTVSDLRLPFSSPPTTRTDHRENIFVSIVYMCIVTVATLPLLRQLRAAEHLFITTLHGPCRKYRLYYYGGVFTDTLPSNRRPIVAHICFRGNVSSDSFPSSG